MGQENYNKIWFNSLALLLCPGIVLIGAMVPAWFGVEDMVQYYAWHALLVELLLIYVPTHWFISQRGGGVRFGLVRISLGEIILSCLLGVGVFLLTTALEHWVFQFFEKIGAVTIYRSKVDIGDGWRIFASVLLLVVIPAYTEEVFLRGALLFSWLPDGKGKAILHSAFLFALLHMNPMQFPVLLFMGLCMGLAAVYCGSCYSAVILHGMNNLLAVLWIVAGDALGNKAEVYLNGTNAWALYCGAGVTGLLFVAICLPLLRKVGQKCSAERETRRQERKKAMWEAWKVAARKAGEKHNPVGSVVSVEIKGGFTFHTSRHKNLPVVLTYCFMGAINLYMLILAFVDLSV